MNRYELWLSAIPGIGSRTILRLKSALQDSPDFARQIYEMTPKEKTQLVSAALSAGRDSRSARRAAGLLCSEQNPEPEEWEELLTRQGIRFTSVFEDEYPQKLLRIPDPPFGLYCRGQFPSSCPGVGIVGTRMASAYGRDQTRVFAKELASHGLQIISGMARGIDGIAGRGALDADGFSCAVLGCGVDICYPRENLDLYEALCDRGCVLSEYPPGTQPKASLFPARNRIISGLSDVLLVMEAREQSGTMITVDRALEYGIDVFALPGRVSDRNSAGCNLLIREGAGIATCPQDILRSIFGEQDSPSPEDSKTDPDSAPVQLSLDFEIFGGETEPRVLQELCPIERAIYDALDESTPRCTEDLLSPASEQLSRRVSTMEVMRTLALLTVKDLVREIRVGFYIRVRPEP